MTIAICDDEKAVRGYIGALIEKRRPDAEIFGFSSGAEVLAFMNKRRGQIDILFLDIALESALDGIETAKLLRQRQRDASVSAMAALPVLIFVTAFANRMPEAFPVHAFQFLVKPYEQSHNPASD